MDTLRSEKSSKTARLLATLLLVFCVFSGTCPAEQDQVIENGVKLVLNADELRPGATFELRFDEAVVKPEQAGKEAAESPLVFHPAAKGTFVWLSQRSGVFTPSEPMPLGTSYRLTLRQGMTDAEGMPLEAELSRSVHTPAMRVSGFWPNAYWHENVTAKPTVQILLNADVTPEQASPFIFFKNDAGKKIAAQVSVAPAKTYFPAYYSSDRSVLTWRQRFEEKQRVATLKNYRSVNESEIRAEAKNLLIATPAQPLPIGSGWRLIVAQGLPSTEPEVSLFADAELKIGNVTPFAVTRLDAVNELNGEKHIQITFSKGLSPEFKAENALQWVTISPSVKNLRAETGGATLSIFGDFENGKPYSIKVAPGFPAVESFTLAGGHTGELSFKPIPSRIYFPEITTHQLSGGSRQLPLLTVNVPDVRLRAKLLDADTVVFALQDFKEYFRQWRRGYNGNEPYQALDYNKIAGRTIFSKQITGSRETDEQQIVQIAWDEVLHGHKTGVVFLTAEEAGNANDRKGAQTLVQVTDLGLAWKCSGEDAWIHVFSHASGRPVSGATVRLLDSKSAVLATGKTNEVGDVRLPTATAKGSVRSMAAWLLAQSGDDFHVAEFGENRDDLSLYSFKLRHGRRHSEEDENSANERQVMLFSDRDVYRPGETVQIKAIVRDAGDDGMEIPAGEKATIRCYDPRGQKIFEKTVTLSDTGALAESIKLPNGSLGSHTARLFFAGDEGAAQPDEGDDMYAHRFQVQEFQPNAFEVKIAAPDEIPAGEKLALPVTANYYMGKTLSKAKLHWSLTAADGDFTADAFAGYFFGALQSDGDEDNHLERNPTEVQLQGEGELSERGEFVITPNIQPNPKAPQPRVLRLLTEITDLNQQTVSESKTMTLASSDFYLGMKKFDGVLHAGEALPVELVAVRADEEPCEQQVSATVRLIRVDWQTNRVEGAGRAGEFRSEADRVVVAKSEVQTVPVQKRGTQFVPVTNTAPTELRVEEAGLYLIEARAKDAGGRDVVTSALVHVAGKDELAWDYKNDFEIKLVPDKEEYLAGQTATLLVKTPIAGEAWVTVEREKVLRSFLTRLDGNAPSVQIPIEKGDAPNVFVSVMILRGTDESTHKTKSPDFRLGYIELKVTNPEAKLTVDVKPYRAEYEPAEEVAITAEVKDATGAPAANAEITLYAVDEGVLSLTGYTTPDPYAFFNTPRVLGVSTGLTLPKLLPEDPEELHFSNKGYLIGDGGDESGGRVRNNFVACAFWSANVRTDAEGRAAAKFTAPDSLSRYRVIAVAHTTRNQFGSGESAITINKPLMLEPALPRFGNVGDKIQVRAVLHNTSGFDGEVEVKLQLDDKAVTGGEKSVTRTLHLANKASASIDVPVEFTETGKAKWTWNATLAVANSKRVFRDAVESKLNVNYPAPLIQEIHLSHSDSANVNLLADVNPALLEGSGIVRVSIANSRLIAMIEPLNRLLHYPYGCVEQTTSSTLPWLSLRDFQQTLAEVHRPDAQIDEAVQHGVNRLFTMQTESGGLAYWPGGSEPMLWGSAYGGMGIALAQKQGHFVPKEKFDRLCKYISNALRGTGGDGFDGHFGYGGPSDRCLAVYTLALAGKSEPSYHELLYKNRERLSPENRALLAMAILESNGSREMVEELLKLKAVTAHADDDYFYCNSRGVAMQLLAWSQFRPANSRVDALLNDLLGSRTGGEWLTTQGNAWSLLGLAGYVRNVERATQQTGGSIAWGAEKQPFQLTGKATVQEMQFRLDSKNPSPGLMLSNPSEAKLFTQVKIEARPRSVELPRQDRGYSLQRNYSKINDDGTLTEARDLRVGDRVLVTLNVGIRERANYIAIDDPLPSIFEAVNPEFKTQQTRAGEIVGNDWNSDFRELREDRALFFRDHVWPGSFTIRYLARVRAAGTATAPAAKIEEMYHPDRFGLTATEIVTSRALE